MYKIGQKVYVRNPEDGLFYKGKVIGLSEKQKLVEVIYGLGGFSRTLWFSVEQLEDANYIMLKPASTRL